MADARNASAAVKMKKLDFIVLMAEVEQCLNDLVIAAVLCGSNVSCVDGLVIGRSLVDASANGDLRSALYTLKTSKLE